MKNEGFVQTLDHCINHCTYCADACLDEDTVKIMVRCIRLNRACAEVCSTLKRMLLTDYSNVSELVNYCIELCKACAEECRKHKMKHCQDCAQACQKCAEACMTFLNFKVIKF